MVEVRRGGDLEVVIAPLDQQRAQALALHRHRLVGDGDAALARGLQRARQLQAAEQLRRERAPQPLARRALEA